MKKLLDYLNSLKKEQRHKFTEACGTSEGYLRKAISVGQRIGADLCISIERESGRKVTCEDMRPDIDWAYLRAVTFPTSNLIPGTPIDGASVREAAGNKTRRIGNYKDRKV